ncbi:sulfite exporter TauE/SafE family protein [Polynucleobacter sp. MWH-P3-07-1]|uniref:sulfite exporter TauE/SafE family protein n=1 Tax=Polynucleobacter sp. MWH-P3-07-1 TaxID=1743173 RepID=UPI001BFDF668|nr:sulfite exporter TauE/SafE family protein [Polynucleobacter sp. MWH-P3-07-1]QWD84031.1 sulfite exporter TauE/SafE family protein [Polynucleobacter sp. MWH-P3-07-1]
MAQFFIDSSHFIISGALVGLLVGMTGVGGGSLMTPLLTIIFGVAPTTAVGTDLAFAAITKGFGTAAHRLHGNVRWDIVRLLCLGSLTTAILSIIALKYVGPVSKDWNHIISLSIGVSVLLTAGSLLFRAKIMKWVHANPKRLPSGSPLKVATALVGAVIGVLVTISSIGAGAIGATLILVLYPTLRPAEVAGTDIAYAVPLTALAGLGHWWLGNVHFDLLAGLLIGSVPAIWLGAKLSSVLSEKITRNTLAATLFLVGLKLVLS